MSSFYTKHMVPLDGKCISVFLYFPHGGGARRTRWFRRDEIRGGRIKNRIKNQEWYDGPLAAQKVPHDGDDAPQLRGLGDLVRPPAPPHDPPLGLPLGLASLLLSAAAPAPAMLSPTGAVLGASSLMDVLDNHNDDNCP